MNLRPVCVALLALTGLSACGGGYTSAGSMTGVVTTVPTVPGLRLCIGTDNAARTCFDAADASKLKAIGGVMQGDCVRVTFAPSPPPGDAPATLQSISKATGCTPTPTPTPTRQPTARPCKLSDVTASLDANGMGATGHFLYQLRFTNVSKTACNLPERPTGAVLIERDGAFLPMDYSSWAAEGGRGGGRMTPGQQAILPIETDEECSARPGGGPAVNTSGKIVVKFGGGTVEMQGAARTFDVGCGLHYATFQRLAG